MVLNFLHMQSLCYLEAWKCDVIGMTNMPEARLAREAEIRYASISMVTDYDCWNKNHSDVTVEKVLEIMENNNIKVQSLLLSFLNYIQKIKYWDWEDDIYKNLDTSIITNLTKVNKKSLKKLEPILRRFINKKKNLYLTSFQIFLYDKKKNRVIIIRNIITFIPADFLFSNSGIEAQVKKVTTSKTSCSKVALVPS